MCVIVIKHYHPDDHLWGPPPLYSEGERKILAPCVNDVAFHTHTQWIVIENLLELPSFESIVHRAIKIGMCLLKISEKMHNNELLSFHPARQSAWLYTQPKSSIFSPSLKQVTLSCHHYEHAKTHTYSQLVSSGQRHLLECNKMPFHWSNANWFIKWFESCACMTIDLIPPSLLCDYHLSLSLDEPISPTVPAASHSHNDHQPGFFPLRVCVKAGW